MSAVLGGKAMLFARPGAPRRSGWCHDEIRIRWGSRHRTGRIAWIAARTGNISARSATCPSHSRCRGIGWCRPAASPPCLLPRCAGGCRFCSADQCRRSGSEPFAVRPRSAFSVPVSSILAIMLTISPANPSKLRLQCCAVRLAAFADRSADDVCAFGVGVEAVTANCRDETCAATI
jgi:hypothetical protein